MKNVAMKISNRVHPRVRLGCDVRVKTVGHGVWHPVYLNLRFLIAQPQVQGVRNGLWGDLRMLLRGVFL